MGVWKNAEFHADFEFVAKSFEKMHLKMVISKNVTAIFPIFTFTLVPQTCFA
jgi:hypothetical protein